MAASFCRRSFINYKNCLFQTQKRTGYVVLIPESPKEVAECNVISLENLPEFSKLTTDACKQIVHKYAQQYDVGTWELDEHLQKKLSSSEKLDVFKEIIEPLEVLSVPFSSSWGVAKTLFIANQKLMPVSTFYTLGDRVLQVRGEKYSIKSIYSACKNHLETEGNNCTDEKKRVLKKFVWEGFHTGFELKEEDRINLKAFVAKIQTKKNSYELKYKNAKSLFKQVISDQKFGSDAPLDLLRTTAVDQSKPLQGPWIITLSDSVYHRFLEYCDSREARKHIWISYNQICSIMGDPRCNAANDIEDIREYRKNFAKMLGFPSYAHLSMKTKMAGSIENVQSVLSTLLEPAKYAQEKEIYELEKFAFENDLKSSLELWDLPFWMRMEKKNKFGLDEAFLKDYFPLGQVFLGLIALCEQLFGIVIEEQREANVWDPDVRYYRVSDEKTKTIFGGFYFDPYSRRGKLVAENDCGWFVAMRPRSRVCASLPLSSLVFNFNPPSDETPCLLYYREVINLFEKFGHMLQFTLTQANYSEVSGTSNIEWDATEICSKFLKFWLTEKGTLESISGHYESGEPLPSRILDNLCSWEKHMAGTRLCQKIYTSNLDLELHLQNKSCMEVAGELWPQHLLFPLSRLDAHPFGFKEIFGNTWGSSFYSRVWSKMIAADVFSAYVEAGLNNHEEISQLGRRFRSTFLSLGGGCEPSEVFRRFRGRDPNPKKLIDILNLKSPNAPLPNVEPELALA